MSRNKKKILSPPTIFNQQITQKCHLIHNNIFRTNSHMFRTVLVHHQGIHQQVLYKTVTIQYFDPLHVWKKWWDSFLQTDYVVNKIVVE